MLHNIFNLLQNPIACKSFHLLLLLQVNSVSLWICYSVLFSCVCWVIWPVTTIVSLFSCCAFNNDLVSKCFCLSSSLACVVLLYAVLWLYWMWLVVNVSLFSCCELLTRFNHEVGKLFHVSLPLQISFVSPWICYSVLFSLIYWLMYILQLSLFSPDTWPLGQHNIFNYKGGKLFLFSLSLQVSFVSPWICYSVLFSLIYWLMYILQLSLFSPDTWPLGQHNIFNYKGSKLFLFSLSLQVSFVSPWICYSVLFSLIYWLM